MGPPPPSNPPPSGRAALGRAVHRYRSAPFGARLFVHGRAFLSDLAFVERFVPKKGFIVDLGCGHGLFACLLREAADTRRVVGIDLDERKIEVARSAIRDTQWLRFEVGDIVKDPPPHCDAVTIVDVLYLLPFDQQEQVLRNAASALGEGGPMIVKAQERRTDPRYAITYAQELVTVGLGFTRGGHERFYFPSRDEAVAMFERAGFVVEVEDMPRRPYTDVVYLARKAPLKPLAAA
ncbi:MAG TPA: class I SAM-dependent methyltransferase [Candidatus Limnocylindria bacterium]|nr:class I SAM-dependent methyltransferase [Candidatus Limnocylindria bacterium]